MRARAREGGRVSGGKGEAGRQGEGLFWSRWGEGHVQVLGEKTMMKRSCGTWAYWAPEILRRQV